MSAKIPVAILFDGGDSNKVISYFNTDIFETFIVTGKNGIPPIENEKHMIRAALKESSERSIHQYCIIIKDTTISSFNSSQIEVAIKNILMGDIIYLTRWNDRCDLMNDEIIIELPFNSSIKYVQTFSPKGFQAICISPTLRDKIRFQDYNGSIDIYLNDLIQNGNITANAYIPNLFEYNAYKYATKTSDFQKINICNSFSQQPISTKKQITAETYFYLTVIIAFFIAIGWGMYLLGPAPKNHQAVPFYPEETGCDENYDNNYELFKSIFKPFM